MSQRQDTKNMFWEVFSSPPTFTTRAPGRVNLIGEHADYNDGFLLSCAINFFVEVSVAPRDDAQIRVIACDFDAEDQFSSASRPPSSHQQWANYVRGVVSALMQKCGTFPHGCNLVISGDVPLGSGLGSSAALEVATGKALQMLYQFDLQEREIVQLGQLEENEFVGCHRGAVDQLISTVAEKHSALLIDCRSLTTEVISMPEDLQLVIIHSNTKQRLADSEYPIRRQQCETAAQHFGVRALRDVSLSELHAAEKTLDPVIFRRARYIISENLRTSATIEALKNQDIAALSTLMKESHASMRDDFEITVPAIDKLVELVAGVIGERGGVRMTGNGCVVALLPKELLNEVFFTLAQEYPRYNKGEAASIYICSVEGSTYVC